jgi:hypothetical protein
MVLNVKKGQLWKLNGTTYRVERTNGADRCYPIELREVERDSRVADEVEAYIASQPAWNRERCAAWLRAPRSMRVELAWFTQRRPKLVSERARAPRQSARSSTSTPSRMVSGS